MNSIELQSLLENGDTDRWEVCYQIAEYYYEHQDYRLAFSWYVKAASLPDCNPIVYFEIGYFYQHGEGVDTDLAEAVSWYERAAENNVPQACYNLAYFYQNGLIVDKNPEKALQMLKTATAIMHQLQMEHFLYEAWKKGYEQQKNDLQNRVHSLEETQEKISQCNAERLQENRCLEEKLKNVMDELSRVKEQNTELACRAEKEQQELQEEKSARKKAEQLSESYCSQMESQARAADNQIKYIVKNNNLSHENMQKSYQEQSKNVQEHYEEICSKLQEKNESLCIWNAELSQSIEEKTKKWNDMEEIMRSLQRQVKSEKKKVIGSQIVIVLLLTAALLVVFF